MMTFPIVLFDSLWKEESRKASWKPVIATILILTRYYESKFSSSPKYIDDFLVFPFKKTISAAILMNNSLIWKKLSLGLCTKHIEFHVGKLLLSSRRDACISICQISERDQFINTFTTNFSWIIFSGATYYHIKGTQEWEFFWLRFWILYYFNVSYA